MQESLHEAIAKLAPGYRSVYDALPQEGWLTTKQVVKILGTTPSSTGSQLCQLRDKGLVEAKKNPDNIAELLHRRTSQLIVGTKVRAKVHKRTSTHTNVNPAKPDDPSGQPTNHPQQQTLFDRGSIAVENLRAAMLEVEDVLLETEIALVNYRQIEKLIGKNG